MEEALTVLKEIDKIQLKLPQELNGNRINLSIVI
jgi:hypothetical protein